MSGKAVRETLGFLAVVLSLVFVGLELRQNTAAVAATALNDMTSGQVEWFYQVTNDPELADVYIRWRDGIGELDPVDDLRATLLMFALLRTAENAYLQTSLGVVDSLALRGYGLREAPPFEAESFRPIWEELKPRFHPDFVAAFEASYDLAP